MLNPDRGFLLLNVKIVVIASDISVVEGLLNQLQRAGRLIEVCMKIFSGISQNLYCLPRFYDDAGWLTYID